MPVSSKSNKTNMKKAFTLIELLVAIAIIGILATVVVVNLSSSQKKARDARRLSDINQLDKALDIYYQQKGYYPVNTDITDPYKDSASGCWSSWDAGNSIEPASDTFLQPLQDEGLMSKTPRETVLPVSRWQNPQNPARNCNYRYMDFSWAKTDYGCLNNYAVVYTELETNTGPTEDRRPSCLSSWGEGARGSVSIDGNTVTVTNNDIVIFKPY